MDNTEKEMIERLQDNLSIIRKIAGWSTEDLASKISVTKQTISNLENKKTPMTLIQYIAIRAFIDCEIEINKENVALAQVVDLLLDQDCELSEEDELVLKEGIEVIAAATSGGASSAALIRTSSTILASLGLAAVSPLIGTSTLFVGSAMWLKKISDKKNKK